MTSDPTYAPCVRTDTALVVVGGAFERDGGAAKAVVRALTKADSALLQPYATSLAKPLSFVQSEKRQPPPRGAEDLTVVSTSCPETLTEWCCCCFPEPFRAGTSRL